MLNRPLRRLSTLERFLWLHDQVEPVHFIVAAQVEGDTTIDAWKAGLSSLQRRHPFLMASIEADANLGIYFVSRPGIPIPLRIVAGNALQKLEAEIARELATPFRDHHALLMRAVLLHEKQRSIVILTAHHSIADGLSLAHLIRDLLQILSGETLAPLPVPPSHEALLGLEEDAVTAEGGGKLFEAETSLHPNIQKLKPHVATLQLNSDFVDKLQQFARQEKTSIHGALASSIVFATRKLGEGTSPLRLASPISTRNRLSRNDDCVMLTGLGTLELAVPASGDFWELARRVKSELSPQTSLENITESRRALQQALTNVFDAEEAVQLFRQGIKVDFVLTNLGNLSFGHQYGQLRLEALWLAVLLGTSENQQVLGVATINGNLSLTYCSYTPIPHLLETMESFLTEAVTQHMSVDRVGAV